MISLIICPITIIINLTSVWHKDDQKVMSRAKDVCYIEYKGCLKKFIKKEEHLYNAICGSVK